MTTAFVDLDVRPILRSGGEPFQMIMETVAALEPHQGLRLFATFKPTPLFRVLGSRGFTPEAKELTDGEWEVLFHRTGADGADDNAVPAAAPAVDSTAWPEPAQHMDNRDLDPPEPMVRILAATETLATGEVLSALLCREPVFLFPELAKRGHQWRGAYEPDGTTYKVLVRIGAGGNGAS
jgi:uncharacterized protein (DUF2249 family)